MAVTKAHQKATNKYNAANYDRLYIRVRKGEKELIKNHADAIGVSINDYIVDAVRDRIAFEDSTQNAL